MDRRAFEHLYPFEPHYLERAGLRLHYLDEGPGTDGGASGHRPVVMLHGNPTWSFMYRDLVRTLSPTRRVIVPDHMGCGLSDRPQDYPYTLGTHIANVEGLLDELGVRACDLVVHDWGGAIGMGYATRWPERVGRIVVCNTGAWLQGKGPWQIRLVHIPGFGAIAVRLFNAFPRAALRMATTRRLPKAVQQGYLAPYDSYANRVAVLRFVQDIPVGPHIPSHAVLREIDERLPVLRDKPMLICWGMRDFCFTPAFLAEWERRFPEATVHRFADAGHYLLEDAGERIASLVQDFLGNSEFRIQDSEAESV